MIPKVRNRILVRSSKYNVIVQIAKCIYIYIYIYILIIDKTHFEVPVLLFFFHISSLYFYFETLHPCTFIFI